jgi:hypothetical protein
MGSNHRPPDCLLQRSYAALITLTPQPQGATPRLRVLSRWGLDSHIPGSPTPLRPRSLEHHSVSTSSNFIPSPITFWLLLLGGKTYCSDDNGLPSLVIV